MNNKKLLVINLDGLSFEQFCQLQKLLPALGSFSQKQRLTSQTGHKLTNSQAMWAEIFTGSPWFNSGCPGYSQPFNNLNDAKIVMESDLRRPVNLIGGTRENPAIVINMPLLLPDERSRIWLADGSLPLLNAVSPLLIAQSAPFNTYRARPFAACASGLANLSQAVESCLSVEYQRLALAAELLKNTNWRICFLHISLFDVLQHLVGSDFLELSDVSFWPQIKDFFIELNCHLSEFLQLADSTALISTFHLSPCFARLNLNDLLSLGGFCQFAGNATNTVIAGRKEAAKTIAKSQKAISKQAQAVVAYSNHLDLKKTVAASPTSGLIYLNRKRYFKDGIVADAEAVEMVDAITSYLSNYFQDQFAGKRSWSIVSIAKDQVESNLNAAAALPSNFAAHEVTPDLLVQIDGVDFHNAQGQGIIDYINHPRSLHAAGGFFCLSNGQDLPEELNTKQVHTILEELVK